MTRALSGSPGDSSPFPLQFGRFLLLEILGEGGMGAVFRAELEGPDGFRKPCALKVLHPRILARGEHLAVDLRAEASLGALLQHPNIVSVYDYGLERGQPWMAMEYVAGVELSDLLRGARKLPAAALLDLALQLASALEHAHALALNGEEIGFVHRDLKPSNILVGWDGRARITDFGIAKAEEVGCLTTRTGITKGTPAYMSPEQATGRPVDRRSDLFSLGALLYEVVTGKRLFRASSAAETILEILNVEALVERPELFEPVDEELAGLGAVLRRCLRKSPDDRFEDAAALGAALRGLGSELPLGRGLDWWLACLPGGGRAFQGLRQRRRIKGARDGGQIRFDPLRDLALATSAERQQVRELPGVPQPAMPWPRTELSKTPPDLELDISFQSLGQRPFRTVAVLGGAVALGLALGLAVVSLLAPKQPQELAVQLPPSSEQGPWAEGGSLEEEQVLEVGPPSQQENDSLTAALGGPLMGPPKPEGLIVEAGAAEVGEAGESLSPPSEQGERSAGSWLEGEGVAADESVVASDGEGARTPPLVLSHPQPVEVVHIGESPSFIVRAEGEEVVSGSVVTRVIGGAWERHPLSAYTDGLWGVRLPVTSGMHDGLHYYFELETVAGAAETLQPQEGAYRVEVLR